jgi:hypothetical protein
MAAGWTDYESETLRRARDLFANWRADDGDISDVTVRLEGVPGEAILLVAFAHRDRPGCRFSYTWHLHGWNNDDYPDEPDQEVPDNQITLLWANLTETLTAADYGLPTNCRPGEVVELGRRPIVIDLELAIRRVLADYADRLGSIEVELGDKLVEAVEPIGVQYVSVWYRRWVETLPAPPSRRQQNGGPDAPLDR